MTDTPQAPPAPIAPAADPAPPPSTPAEAATRLNQLRADSTWTSALLRGLPAQTREWHSLHELVDQGSDTDVALSGALPEMPSLELREMAGVADMLKSIGFTPLSIRETLEGRPASQAEVDMATKWKADHFSNAEWVKRLFSGDVEARRHLLTANVILSSPLKKEGTA
jgi:hypothetical protein